MMPGFLARAANRLYDRTRIVAVRETADETAVDLDLVERGGKYRRNESVSAARP
jgi:hypothetical protein